MLILDDGTTLFDCRVILEYLDHRAGGGKIIPREPRRAFRRAAAAGARRRHDRRARCWCSTKAASGRPSATSRSGSTTRTTRSGAGFAALEAAPPPIDPIPNVGQIALACLLGHRDLRFKGAWREGHPKLVAWLDRFAAQVPAFDETKVAA